MVKAYAALSIKSQLKDPVIDISHILIQTEIRDASLYIVT